MSVTIEDLEQQIEDNKKVVAKRDLALKLSKNPEFRQLILEEFCVQECARYAQISGDPSVDASGRADALNIAQAAGHLKRWLSILVRMGHQAEQNIFDSEQELEELRSMPEGEGVE